MRVTRDLTSDGALRLVLDGALVPLAERWVPEEPGGATARRAGGARIEVRCSARPTPRPPSVPTLSLGPVRAWQHERRGVVQLCGGVSAFVYRFDGELIHLAAHHHTVTSHAREAFERRYPAPPSRAGK